MPATNPYTAPQFGGAVVPLESEVDHLWRGRKLSVSARAAGRLLWLDNAIRVRIDDVDVHQQSLFHNPRQYEFRFRHEGADVTGLVRRRWRFLPHLINYQLIVEDEFVDESQAVIQFWRRGVAVTLLLNVAVLQWVIWRMF